ncbi:hypothetical protein LINPERPRIM_LOCUS6987 [Linum perenne]
MSRGCRLRGTWDPTMRLNREEGRLMRRRRRRSATATAGCCPKNQEKRGAFFSVLFQGCSVAFFFLRCCLFPFFSLPIA